MCNKTFARFYTSAVVNINNYSYKGAFTDSTYKQADAMQNWTTAYTWKKMSEHFPAASGYKIFENNAQTSINIDDTIQGYLGNCWMLSSMAAIAEVPARIWRMFKTKSYNGKGIYSIHMYELGAPI